MNSTTHFFTEVAKHHAPDHQEVFQEDVGEAPDTCSGICHMRIGGDPHGTGQGCVVRICHFCKYLSLVSHND